MLNCSELNVELFYEVNVELFYEVKVELFYEVNVELFYLLYSVALTTSLLSS